MGISEDYVRIKKVKTVLLDICKAFFLIPLEFRAHGPFRAWVRQTTLPQC